MLCVLGQWVPSDADDPEAAKERGLEPIQGPPLNLMGMGDGQKTRSTVQYKVLLFDTGGGRWRWLPTAWTTSCYR
jgi:hypothetical protein